MQNKFGPVWGPKASGKGYFENCTSFGLDQTEQYCALGTHMAT